jgi:hypothetical protein
VGVTVASNFQTGNEINLLMEYENMTQRVLLLAELMLQNAKQLQHAHLYFIVSGLKIIGHGNTDSVF